CQQHNIYPFTF
nr:immunoglobulin light chain junction region [Macaca mulatta]